MAEYTVRTGEVDSKAFAGKLDATYVTAREAAMSDLEFKKRVWPGIFKSYGNARYTFMDLLTMQTPFNFIGRDITLIEEQNLDYLIEVGDVGSTHGINTTANGAVAYLILAASGYDSNTGALRLRVGDSVIIPHAYTSTGNNEHYRIQSISSGSGATTKWALHPYNVSAGIATEVPIGTKLMRGPWKTSVGGGQPSSGYIDYLNARKFYTQIIGETVSVQGGVKATALESWYKRDGVSMSNMVTEALWQTEFMFDRKIDQALFTSSANTNTSNVTDTDQYGAASAVKSVFGYREHAVSRAQLLNYDSTQPWDYFKFDLIDEIFDTQKVSDGNIVVGCGPDLYKSIENGGLEFTKEYSKTDLMRSLDELGVSYRAFTKGTRTYTFVLIDTLRDTTGLGLVNLGHRQEGFMIPSSTVKVQLGNGSTSIIPNLQIGYLNNNGENRTRMTGPISGVNGYGLPFSHQYDNTMWAYKTEMGLVALGMNQNIFLTPTSYRTT